MTRKKRDDNRPDAAERPDAAGPAETPFEAQAAPGAEGGTPKPAEDGTPDQQAAEPGAPIAAIPEVQSSDGDTPAAAEAEAAPADAPAEPVVATPETQQAEPEPVREEAAATAAPRRSGVSAGSAFFLGLIAALLVAGLAAAGLWAAREQVAQMLTPAEDPRIGATEGRVAENAQRIEQLAAQVGTLDRTVAGLREQVAALGQQQPAPAQGAAVDLGPLTQRVQALETAMANRVDPERVASLEQGLQRLSNDVAQVQDSVASLSKSAADAATVLRLTDRIEAAETAVRQAQSRANTAQNLLLAVGQLREAANRGEGFDAELRAVGAIAGNEGQVSQQLQALAPFAAQGVPTRAVLIDRFDALAGRMVRADFGPEEDGWWRQTVQRLSSVVTVRRTEGEVAGDSVAAVVARAESALDKGNLAGAVQELESLQGPAAQVAQPWIKDAKARLAAEKAISDLTAHVVAQTKAGG